MVLFLTMKSGVYCSVIEKLQGNHEIYETIDNKMDYKRFFSDYAMCENCYHAYKDCLGIMKL